MQTGATTTQKKDLSICANSEEPDQSVHQCNLSKIFTLSNRFYSIQTSEISYQTAQIQYHINPKYQNTLTTSHLVLKSEVLRCLKTAG